MNDNFIRHLVAFIAAIICVMAYVSGYVSSQYGWWWTGFGVLIVYGGVYRIIDK
jgi:hypothetical protein